MLPTKAPDVWAKANEGNILQALALLAALPSRQADDAALDKETFFIALEGVTRHGLIEATKAILRGELGHAFFPSPPELRMQCDKGMEWHERMRDRIRRNEQAAAQRPPEKRALTPQERERQAERMRQFHRSIGADPDSVEGNFMADMEAKYGADALASVPDNPRRFDVPGFSRPKA
jgi:hypothetical protein